MLISRICIMVGLLLFSFQAANAQIVSTTGAMTKISPPASVRRGALESNTTIFVFEEIKNYELTSNLATNMSKPGILARGWVVSNDTIPAGTKINSYYTHVDPVGSKEIKITGSVSFREKIIGIIFGSTELDQSDFLGNANTLYHTGYSNRVLSFDMNPDAIALTPDSKSIFLNSHAGSYMDQVRIITSADSDICPNSSGLDSDKDGDIDGNDLSFFASEFGRLDCTDCPEGSLQLMVPVYGQGQQGQEWGEEQLGTCATETIASYGCAITSITMVLGYYGIETDPATLNDWLTANNGYTGGCYVNWEKIDEFTAGQIDWIESRDYTTVPADLGFIKQELDNGYPVIAEVRLFGSQHFVVITGYVKDTFFINDPWYSNKSTINERYFNDPALAIYGIRLYHGNSGN